MKITKATLKDLCIVQEIVSKTISCVYPNYYPTEVVDFFLSYHNEENIKKDIVKGNVYLLSDHSQVVGTGTIDGKTIGRLYVLIESQGKGYGHALITFLENIIAEQYEASHVEASLPSYEFYLKLGYKPIEYHRYEVENNRMLCYYAMEKELNIPYEIPVIIKDE